jgi:hypothetical protein
MINLNLFDPYTFFEAVSIERKIGDTEERREEMKRDKRGGEKRRERKKGEEKERGV